MAVKASSRAHNIGGAIKSKDVVHYSIFAKGGLYAHDLCTALENKSTSDLYVAIADGNTKVNLDTGIMSDLELTTHRIAAGQVSPTTQCWKEFNIGESIAAGTVALSGTGNIVTTIPYTGLASGSYYVLAFTVQKACTLTLPEVSDSGFVAICNSSVLKTLAIKPGLTRILVQTVGNTGTAPTVVLTCGAGETTGITNTNKANYVSLHLVTEWTMGQANVIF